MNALSLKKKGLALVVAAVAMLCFTTPAFAGNHVDSGYSAYFTSWNTADTPNRQKQDKTPAYIKTQSVTANRTVRAWLLGFNNEDVRSGTAKLKSGQHAYAHTYAFEIFGRKQVHFRLQNAAAYSGTTTVYGVWSPDSVNY